MKINHLLRISCLSALLGSAAAAPKDPAAEAQSFYDRAITVYKVDPGASIQLFNRAAKLGHADAMVRLAHAYQTGTGASRSLREALKWYTQAAEAGNIAAMTEVGAIYEQGISRVPVDYAQAIEWYEKGVSNNSLKACSALARIYASCSDPAIHNGPEAIKYASILVKKDSRDPVYMDLLAAAFARNIDFMQALKASSQAVSLSALEEAATRRERKEQYEQGMPYPAIASDAWILEAAEKENRWAVLKLAELHGDILGELYDPVVARHWYEIAAENHTPEALFHLGHMCFNGEGGEVDMKKAFWCFSESAKAGNTQAYGPLARMLVGGRGTGQDFEQALEWYQKAIDAGHRHYSTQFNALRLILRESNRPSPEELVEQATTIIANEAPNKKGEIPTLAAKTNEVLPRYWLAAEQGNTNAMKALADMFFYGRRYFVRTGDSDDRKNGGVSPNYTRALDYYQQLKYRGIESPEMETCKELHLVELKDRRARQLKKENDKKRAASRAAQKAKVAQS